MSVWSDIHTNGSKVQVGLFGGYTKNLGASESVLAVMGGRSNIDFVYRVAPRVIFNSGKMRFAFEVEYTTAGFGTINNMGVVENATDVSNLRLLLAAYYFF